MERGGQSSKRKQVRGFLRVAHPDVDRIRHRGDTGRDLQLGVQRLGNGFTPLRSGLAGIRTQIPSRDSELFNESLTALDLMRRYLPSRVAK